METIIKSQNKKGEEIAFNLKLNHAKTGIEHRFSAELLDDNLTFGEINSTVSKVDFINKYKIWFGSGEIKRQGTYPFVVFQKMKTNKNDRYFFQIPENVIKELKKQ
jgi:hypothetical protein